EIPSGYSEAATGNSRCINSRNSGEFSSCSRLRQYLGADLEDMCAVVTYLKVDVRLTRGKDRCGAGHSHYRWQVEQAVDALMSPYSAFMSAMCLSRSSGRFHSRLVIWSRGRSRGSGLRWQSRQNDMLSGLSCHTRS